MNERPFNQIAFMPYAPIECGLRIGNYEVWPYYRESSLRINNMQVIQRLNNIFGRYFERKFNRKKGYDHPLEELFIVSPINFEIGTAQFSKDQFDDIRSVSHIIAFCAINETSFTSSSSDSFILYFQNFRIDSEGIALENMYFSKLYMVKFMKPYHLDEGLVKFKGTELCNALGKALQFKHKAIIKRIFRTLELFYHTASHAEMMTDEHRLLSLAMCFEVLLNYKGKIHFMKKLDNMLEHYSPQMLTRIIKIKDKDKSITKPKTCWWAFDLYRLRSSIIHGDKIDWEINRYGDIWTRIEFGGILLRKLIKKILFKEKLWELDEADSIFEAGSLDEKLDNIVNDFIQYRVDII